MVRCSNCKRDNPPGSRYCINCGQKLPRDDVINCTSCGKQNNPGDLYCVHCGSRISRTDPQVHVLEIDSESNDISSLPVWKVDYSAITFCPSCNYGCTKSMLTCPICGSALNHESGAPYSSSGSFVDGNLDSIDVSSGSRSSKDTSGDVSSLSPDDRDRLRLSVKTDLLRIIQNYGIISMKDLAGRYGVDEGYVLDVVKDLIVAGEVDGHIDKSTLDGNWEFISEITGGTLPMLIDDGDSRRDDDMNLILDEPERLVDLKSLIRTQEKNALDSIVLDLVQNLRIMRGFDFIGGKVHLKIVLRNDSKFVIHDVKIYLDIPKMFKVEGGDEMRLLHVLSPGESRGLDWYLYPMECGTAEVSATVLFKDIYGKRHSKLVPALSVQVKSPIISAFKSDLEHAKHVIEGLNSDMKIISFKDIDDSELIYSVGFRAVSRFDMACIHDHRGGDQYEAWFSAESKVDREPLILRLIVSMVNKEMEIRAWCNDPSRLTGFLANLIMNLNEEFSLIRSMKSSNRKRAIHLLSLGRNIEKLKNLAGLNWYAGEILLVLKEIKYNAEKVSEEIDLGRVIAGVNEWIDTVSKSSAEVNITSEIGERLYNDAEFWEDIIDTEFKTSGNP
ncbi:MAG: double zinc ribbon domain-containing protein, partial [Promethearchaeota archaeon]